MATSDVERVLDEWAYAWSAHDPDRLVALFTDDGVYEDVTFGVVSRGQAEVRAFAQRIFAGAPDFKLELTVRFVADNRASMEWTMSGTHQGDFARMPATGKRFSAVRGADDCRTAGEQDPALLRLLGCGHCDAAGWPAACSIKL